jgi:steroid delta-isomerase-like uncharacterized protein
VRPFGGTGISGVPRALVGPCFELRRVFEQGGPAHIRLFHRDIRAYSLLDLPGEDIPPATRNSEEQMIARQASHIRTEGLRDLSIWDEILSSTYVLETRLAPTSIQGIEAAKRFVEPYHDAFPDLRGTVEDLVAEGDKIAVQFKMQGTHRGPFMGVPATGKQVTVTGMAIVQVANGKIAQESVEIDMLGGLQTIGAIPVNPPA